MLYLKGEFDNAAHNLALQNLAASNCGEKLYNYVRAFLRDRTATTGLGGMRCNTIQLPARATPQGPSPTLNTIAMAFSTSTPTPTTEDTPTAQAQPYILVYVY